MKLSTHKQDSRVIVYDADCIEQASPQLFDADAWQREGAVVGVAEGRGSTLLLDTDFGPAVLRQCLRGGWPARISRSVTSRSSRLGLGSPLGWLWATMTAQAPSPTAA